MATYTNEGPTPLILPTLDPPVELQPGESCEIPGPEPAPVPEPAPEPAAPVVVEPPASEPVVEPPAEPAQGA